MFTDNNYSKLFSLKTNLNYSFLILWGWKYTNKPTKIKLKHTQKLRLSHIHPLYHNFSFTYKTLYPLPLLFASYIRSQVNTIQIIIPEKIKYRKDNLWIRNYYMKTPLHMINYTQHDYLLWKYDRLKYFKSKYHNQNVTQIIQILIQGWIFIPKLQLHSSRYQKNPWRGRLKGTHKQINHTVGKISYLIDDLTTIAQQNKQFIPLILHLLVNTNTKLNKINNTYQNKLHFYSKYITYLPLLLKFHYTNILHFVDIPEQQYFIQPFKQYSDSSKPSIPNLNRYTTWVDMNDYIFIDPSRQSQWQPTVFNQKSTKSQYNNRDQFKIKDKYSTRTNIQKQNINYHFYINKPWNTQLTQSILTKFIAQLPLPYWSIYSHYIQDYDKRNLIVNHNAKHTFFSAHKAHPLRKKSYKYHVLSSHRIRGLPAQNKISPYYNTNDY